MPKEEGIARAILAAVIGNEKINRDITKSGLRQNRINTINCFLSAIEAGKNHCNFMAVTDTLLVVGLLESLHHWLLISFIFLRQHYL